MRPGSSCSDGADYKASFPLCKWDGLQRRASEHILFGPGGWFRIGTSVMSCYRGQHAEGRVMNPL